MVERTFVAIDNDTLIDNTTGNGVINNSGTPDGTVLTYTGGSVEQIVLDDNQGSRQVFADGQQNGHVIVDGAGLVADGANVESESRIELEELDSDGNPTGTTVTIYVFSEGGVSADVWGFATTDFLKPGTNYVKIGGSNSGSSRYNDYAACFAAGTIIKTEQGKTPVEELVKGQRVWTQSAGYQPIVWTSSTVTSGQGNFAPVVFEKDALGNTKELVVSQQHRVLLTGTLAELYFATPEVMVAAKHLVGLPGVSITPRDQIEYCHFMFEKHQIVEADGCLAESFFFAEQSINALEADPRRELMALFPELAKGIDDFGPSAARVLSAKEASLLSRNALQ